MTLICKDWRRAFNSCLGRARDSYRFRAVTGFSMSSAAKSRMMGGVRFARTWTGFGAFVHAGGERRRRSRSRSGRTLRWCWMNGIETPEPREALAGQQPVNARRTWARRGGGTHFLQYAQRKTAELGQWAGSGIREGAISWILRVRAERARQLLELDFRAFTRWQGAGGSASRICGEPGGKKGREVNFSAFPLRTGPLSNGCGGRP